VELVAGNDTAFNLLAGNYTLTIPLTFSRIVTNISCFGGGDGAIDITVGGGQAPYTYDWNGPSYFSSNDDISGLLAGTYNFILTDDNNCTLDTSVIITQPTALALSTSQVNITCKGLANGSATVTTTGGTAPYTYLWDDAAAQTTATANNLLVGSYEVIVTDDNGCKDSISVTLTEPADSLALTLVSVGNVLCNGGNTGNIQVSTAGGTPGYSYSWTNGSTNEDLNNVVAGTYTLTVTDNNGCQDVLSATITQPTALNIVLNPSAVSCFGASTGAVNATISGATAPYSFAWVGPNGFTASTEDIASLAAGTYTLTVTDDNGCSANQTAIVMQPANVSIGFSSVPVSCFGGNDGSLTANVISGGTAPFSYQWDAAANNQVGATATGLVAGTYQVTVSDNNGCSYSNSGTVTQPNLPLNISASATDITCAGYNNGTASVTASGGTPGYTYLWNDPQGQTTATATNLAPGTYQVTVTDNNGCFETDTISIIEPEAIGIVAIGDSTNCFGDATGSISITASGGTTLGYVYSIDGGETFQNSPDFFNLPAGVYNEVVVQDLGSVDLCLSPEITVTIFEQPFFSFEVVPGDTTLQLEESVTLELLVNSPFYANTDIAQVTWYPTTGLNCSDCVDPTVLTYENYTEYVATVYYEGGDNELCSAISSTVIIVENNLQLFIPNAFTPGSFDNVNEVFEVYGEGIEYVTMQVYNRWGEKIFESSNQRVAWDGTYQGVLQNPGVYTYYVNVEYLDGKQVEKKGSVTLIR
jgi:gliding motility-associated-like protein